MVALRGGEVDGHKSQPDDAGGVHGEADELGLVECFGDVPRQYGVHRADDCRAKKERKRIKVNLISNFRQIERVCATAAATVLVCALASQASPSPYADAQTVCQGSITTTGPFSLSFSLSLSLRSLKCSDSLYNSDAIKR